MKNTLCSIFEIIFSCVQPPRFCKSIKIRTSRWFVFRVLAFSKCSHLSIYMLLCRRLWLPRPLAFIVRFSVSPSEAWTVFHLFVCVCFAHLLYFQLIWSEIILILQVVGYGLESTERSLDYHDKVPYRLGVIGTLAVLLFIFDVQFWTSIWAVTHLFVPSS